MEPLRPCKTCRGNTLPMSDPFKNCASCRAKKVTRKRKTVILVPSNDVQGTSKVPTTSSSSATAHKDKQKSVKMLHKLERKAKTATKMEVSRMLANRANSSKALEISRVSEQVRQQADRVFQTAGEMYDELRSKAVDAHDNRYLLEFYGCYSIITVKSISHQQRVAMVTKNLVDIDLLLPSFINGGDSEIDRSSFFTSYQCSCQPRGDCFGQIKVTAETDNSHTGGIAGQKISVRVHHR